MKIRLLLSAAVALGLLSSCSKDNKGTPDPGTPGTGPKGNVVMKFENVVGGQALRLNGPNYAYANANGDSFKVTTYKYYISNITFINSDGTAYAEPESYHLLDEVIPASLSFTVSGLPPGTYTGVKILMGIDSTHNVSGAQTGDLDPIHGMFWTWNTGYIMAKIEGIFKNTTTSTNDVFSFHLGGFSGKFSVLNEVTLSLPQNLVVGTNTTSTMTLKSDALKWFDSPVLIKLQELNQVGLAGASASTLAKNFSHSLSVTNVQN